MSKLIKIFIEAVVITLIVKVASYIDWKKLARKATEDFKKQADYINKDIEKRINQTEKEC